MNKKDKMEELQSDFTATTTRFDEISVQIDSFPMVDQEKQISENFKTKWTNFVNLTNQTFEMAKSAQTPDDYAKAEIFLSDEVDTVRIELGEDLQRIANFQNESADANKIEAEATSKNLSFVTLIAVAFGFLLAITLGWIFSTQVSKTLTNTIQNLTESLDNVKRSALILIDETVQLEEQILSQRSAVEQTVTACAEITATVEKNSEYAEISDKKTEDCQVITSSGSNAIVSMSTAMTDVANSFEKISQEISVNDQNVNEITKLIYEIKSKTSVVNEIVFQTRLLSFNASVEAARAGEHGKGFAVVAEEVGKLAQMSGRAANEINLLIDASLQKIETIFSGMQKRIKDQLTEGKDKVAQGENYVGTCNQLFTQIKSAITDVRNASAEVKRASVHQSTGISEINNAMGLINNSAQQSSLATKKVSDLSRTFDRLSVDMKYIVEKIVVILHGRSFGSVDQQANDSDLSDSTLNDHDSNSEQSAA